MRTISVQLQNHLNGEITTLATCWKLTRTDGVTMGFTDHDADLPVGSVTYRAQSGFTPSAVMASSGLNVDNLEVQGMLDSQSITKEDVIAGRYDYAEVEVFQVNYQEPEAGRIMVRRGWLGEITLKNGQFVAEVRGLTQKLSQQLGSLYSPACRAKLGDAQCKVAMAAYTKSGMVGGVTSNAVFRDAARSEENGYFANGKITFTSGANAGLAMEIKEFTEGEFVLVLPMPYAIAPGDAYSAVAGCDKNFATCVARFGNAANFRGEPHVPGIDRMLETSATRSEWN